MKKNVPILSHTKTEIFERYYILELSNLICLESSWTKLNNNPNYKTLNQFPFLLPFLFLLYNFLQIIHFIL